MNVQDVQEIVHYERKDLMPEGERRVEFHAHTNMSTMDALPEVEEIVATAAKWGTQGSCYHGPWECTVLPTRL